MLGISEEEADDQIQIYSAPRWYFWLIAASLAAELVYVVCKC